MKPQRHRLLWLLLAGIILPLLSSGQVSKRANIWYFGFTTGLDFSSGQPQLLTNGVMGTDEGSASLSDEAGTLLLYSNGERAWNRNHQEITNQLGGSNFASQAALLVPQPGSSQLHLFSADYNNRPGGLQHAVINVDNAGNATVLRKNTVLLPQSPEKITALPHCNTRDYWVVVHEAGNNTFRAYLLDQNGLSATPVVSQAGRTHGTGSNDGIGYMKGSPNGRKLAVALFTQNLVEVFDFDNTTGRVSSPVVLDNVRAAYGLEFSPSSQYLYVTGANDTPGRLFQYDLNNPSPAAARVTLAADLPFVASALQNGPDGKIYLALLNSPSLGVINVPNAGGTACNFVANGLSIAGRNSRYGLPNFPTGYFKPEAEVRIRENRLSCADVTLEADIAVMRRSAPSFRYQWFLEGSPVAGATQDKYKPTRAGTYRVEIEEVSNCPARKFTSEPFPFSPVSISAEPKASPLGCARYLLQANAGSNRVQWTGPALNGTRATQDTLVVTGQTGEVTYRVRISSPTDPDCFVEKELKVNFTRPADYKLNLPPQTACRESLSLRASATPDWDTFSWILPDNSTVSGATATARSGGVYTVVARSSTTGCESRDQVTVTLTPAPPPPTITAPATVCQGEPLPTLQASGTGLTWYSDAGLTTQVATGTSFQPVFSGARPDVIRYYVTQTVSGSCVSAAATVEMAVRAGPVLQLSRKDYTGCFSNGDIIRLDGGPGPNWIYEWRETGIPQVIGTQRQLMVSKPGSFSLRVSDGQCSSTEVLTVTEGCTAQFSLPDAFTPNGDGLNDQFELKGRFITRFDLKVYNRWGSVVFALAGTDPANETGKYWDGTYRGEPVSAGLYTYRLTIWQQAGSGETSFSRQGTVFILR